MADYYTLFSDAFEIKPEAGEWLKQILKLDPEEPEQLKALMELLDADEHEVDCWPQFGWDIHESMLVCFSEETADMNHVAYLLQAYIRKYEPQAKMCATWANTCSAMRTGEFGGGYIIVTADEIISENSWMARDKMLKELKGE